MFKRNRSFTELVAQVEAALVKLDESEDAVRVADDHLKSMQEQRQKAIDDLAGVRATLFKEYPELMGEVQSPPPVAVVPETGYEPIEVDDADDPRYTGGVAPEPSGGGIEFRERE